MYQGVELWGEYNYAIDFINIRWEEIQLLENSIVFFLSLFMK